MYNTSRKFFFDQEDNSKDVEGGKKESHDDGTFVGLAAAPLPAVS